MNIFGKSIKEDGDFISVEITDTFIVRIKKLAVAVAKDVVLESKSGKEIDSFIDEFFDTARVPFDDREKLFTCYAIDALLKTGTYGNDEPIITSKAQTEIADVIRDFNKSVSIEKRKTVVTMIPEVALPDMIDDVQEHFMQARLHLDDSAGFTPEDYGLTW